MIAGMIMALNAPRANPIQRAINILTEAGPGAWYDPSDLRTLFQDSAGTTPVTAVEQPVGLVLDKSQGLVLGSELVTNGDFSNGTTGWSAGNAAVLSVVSGRLRVTNGAANYGFASQTMTTVAGRAYVATLNLTKGTLSGPAHLRASFTSGGAQELGNAGISASGAVRLVFTAASATTYLSVLLNNENGAYSEFDNISVKELPGNHAIQPTATSRPTLSSRYNLLTKTEAFDAWPANQNVEITANATTSTSGLLTVDKITASATADVRHCVYTFASTDGALKVITARVKPAGYTKFAISDLSAGTFCVVFDLTSLTYAATVGAQTSVSCVSAPGGFVDCSVTVSTTAGGSYAPCFAPVADTYTENIYGPIYTGDGTSGVYVEHVSITQASDASLPYQRVNTATDYDFDFAKFPAYLKFDGIDDSLYSAASVDFTSTDKMTVFAGVHKAAAGVTVPVELSDSVDYNNSAFNLATDVAWANWYLSSGAVAQGQLKAYVTTGDAPVTSVLSVAFDRALSTNAQITARMNGATPTPAVDYIGTASTGNFGNYPLYIGRRNNASFPFSGRIYQLAIKGKAMTAAEISTLESYINSKTKAF